VSEGDVRQRVIRFRAGEVLENRAGALVGRCSAAARMLSRASTSPRAVSASAAAIRPLRGTAGLEIAPTATGSEIPRDVAVYVSLTPVDLRQGFHGLSEIARRLRRREVEDGGIFVFANQRGDHVKLPWVDKVGMNLFYRRVYRGTFEIPSVAATGSRRSTGRRPGRAPTWRLSCTLSTSLPRSISSTRGSSSLPSVKPRPERPSPDGYVCRTDTFHKRVKHEDFSPKSRRRSSALPHARAGCPSVRVSHPRRFQIRNPYPLEILIRH
jgi:hypothetical protein